ncbi:hypothetical protein [uncultured Winogradskyella sp.]|uniref:hypothetical protein n=1 Tax=uncultured Winogradskyella sp. TaxID=395353 RepID=UPI002637CC70|nr:hypothetical protein [uncultured Winogradskyella sp.]
MKKVFGLLMIFAIALSSCSKDEPIEEQNMSEFKIDENQSFEIYYQDSVEGYSGSSVLCANKDFSEGRSVVDGKYYKVVEVNGTLLVFPTSKTEALIWCEKNGVHF